MVPGPAYLPVNLTFTIGQVVSVPALPDSTGAGC